MQLWRRPFALSLALTFSSVGCAGYCPVRWPRSDLWSPSVDTTPVIEWPSTALTDYPKHLEQEHVTLVVEFIDPQLTKGLFHADLLRHGIQPVVVIIHNESEQPYGFRKADVDAHYLPAARVAHWAMVHPARTTVRFMKWLTFLIPGVVVESIVEPTSTLDFPGLEEAACRPAIPNNRYIHADFLHHEIADAEVGPHSSLAGLMFIRPPILGSIIPVSLVNTQTRQPLIFEVPTPPAVYVDGREYAQSFDLVWDAALKTATAIRSWRLMAVDKASGVITVKNGFTFLRWGTAAQIILTIEKGDPSTRATAFRCGSFLGMAPRRAPRVLPVVLHQHTRVNVQSTLRRATSVGSGEHSATIDRLLKELDSLFPQEAPPVPHPPRTMQ